MDSTESSAETTNSGNLSAKQSSEQLLLSEQETFNDQVLPELQKSCGRCHANHQTPFFASDDRETARRAIIDGGKVDFNEVSESRLVLQLKDNHNCPNGDCQATVERFVEVLTRWKKSRVSQPLEGLKTIDLDPAVGALSYDLNNLKIPAQLLAEVEPLTRGTGYLLRDLRLETNQSIFVRVIKPVINDRWNALNTSFLQLNCAVEPPGGRLQGRAATTVVADNLGANNRIAFVFSELRLATDDDPICRDDGSTVVPPSDPASPAEPATDNSEQSDFFAKIRPIMIDSCQASNCHTTTVRSYLFNYQQARQRRATIDQRITSDNVNLRMPPPTSDKQLSAVDRDILLDWLVD